MLHAIGDEPAIGRNMRDGRGRLAGNGAGGGGVVRHDKVPLYLAKIPSRRRGKRDRAPELVRGSQGARTRSARRLRDKNKKQRGRKTISDWLSFFASVFTLTPSS